MNSQRVKVRVIAAYFLEKEFVKGYREMIMDFLLWPEMGNIDRMVPLAAPTAKPCLLRKKFKGYVISHGQGMTLYKHL